MLCVVLVLVTGAVELPWCQAVDVEHSCVPTALPCCDGKIGPRIDPGRKGREAVPNYILWLEIAIEKTLLDGMRI